MTFDSSDKGVGTTKIDRVIDKYELGTMANELEKRWLGSKDAERYSTRELADYFNKEILRSAIESSDTFTLSGNADDAYHALTDQEDADAALARSRLEQSSVDVKSVTDDFISHQTVYRYLKQHRGVEQPQQSPEEKLEKAVDTVQKLQGRTTAVTEQKIQAFKNNSLISVGEFSVLTDVQIICENCGRSHDATTFFRQRGCDCTIE